jgi:hypothetical protein
MPTNDEARSGGGVKTSTIIEKGLKIIPKTGVRYKGWNGIETLHIGNRSLRYNGPKNS